MKKAITYTVLDAKAIKKRMADAIRSTGMKIPDFCYEAGISERALYSQGNKTCLPRLETISIVSENCGVSLNYLVYGEER